MAFVLLKPSAIARNMSGAGLRAILTLDGAFATPEVAYRLNADRLIVNEMGLVGFAAQGAARVDAEQIMNPVDEPGQRILGLAAGAGGAPIGMGGGGGRGF